MQASALAEVDVLREGDRDGSRSVLRITPKQGPSFHAVAVPQDWHSYTGPTWVYIVNANDGLTLIDAGSSIVVEHVSKALDIIGIDGSDVERVIISHGHLDHDGGALALARAWQMEVWAHILWEQLRFHDRSEVSGEGYARVREALDDEARSPEPLSRIGADRERIDRQNRYSGLRREVDIARLIEHGDQASGFTFYHTPGHAPDEMTIQWGNVLFAGDHILPEITPHPTIKTRLPEHLRERLPEPYRDENLLYGLDVYLRSLHMIEQMGEDVLVMPAHRLVNRGRLNLLTSARAGQIAEHHLERLETILGAIGSSALSLGEITKALFARTRLQNVYEAALREVMAHIELLVRCGDVVMSPEGLFTLSGSQQYLTTVNRGGPPTAAR